MAERIKSMATPAPDKLTMEYGGDGNAVWRLSFVGNGVTSDQVGCGRCKVKMRCTMPGESEGSATFAFLAGNSADLNVRYCK